LNPDESIVQLDGQRKFSWKQNASSSTEGTKCPRSGEQIQQQSVSRKIRLDNAAEDESEQHFFTRRFRAKHFLKAEEDAFFVHLLAAACFNTEPNPPIFSNIAHPVPFGDILSTATGDCTCSCSMMSERRDVAFDGCSLQRTPYEDFFRPV